MARRARVVFCALNDELPHVIDKLGDDFIVTATDFPHGDAFRQDQLAQGLKKRGDLSDSLIEKNPLGKCPGDCIPWGTSEISDCNPTCGRALADGRVNGNLYAMITTIDHAGRLVIPKDIRRESGIKPGMPLEVRWEKGAIAITPAPLPVKLERKGRLLVAVPTEGAPRLSADTVERTRKALRKERSGAST